MSNKVFNFPIVELCQRADKLCIFYQRDANNFAKYGFSNTDIEKLQADTAQLKEMPSDDYYQGARIITTEQKKQAKQRLIDNINDLRLRVKLVYGFNSQEYKLFKFRKLQNITYIELVQYALHAVNTAIPRLEALSERMVTQELLDAILADREILDEKIDDQAVSDSLRREKTMERNNLANTVYDQMRKLSEVGKIIWKGVNEAYYTDYVIYGSPKSIEEPAEIAE